MPEIAYNLRFDRQNPCFIDGQWITEVSTKQTRAAYSALPEFTDEWYVPACGRDEVQRAILAADRSMKLWNLEATPFNRHAILQKWAATIRKHAAAIAELVTIETGKSGEEAESEVEYAISFFEWYAGEAVRAYGDVLPNHIPRSRGKLLTLKQPVGVVAIVTPWNFPIAMLARKLAGAVAAGCGCVVRPSSQTPLCALAIARCGQLAGVPNGIVNIVTGDTDPLVEELCQNPIVKKFTFTGSNHVGIALAQKCARTMKKMTLELGGNAPLIVFADADLTLACREAVASRMRNAGQTCVCANRFFIHKDVYDTFVQMLIDECSQLDAISPLVRQKSVDKVEKFIRDAVHQFHPQITQTHHNDGLIVSPTILKFDLEKSLTGEFDQFLAANEIFGPVMPCVAFTDEAEVIARCNDCPQGLAGYVFSQDLARALRVSEELECGLIGVNTARISTAHAPFGGVKESGVGREGSKYGLQEFQEIKYINLHYQ